MNRRRISNRRSHETIAFVHDEQRYKVGIGRELVCVCVDPPRLGPVVEVFLNAQKVNSALDAVVRDGAILMSLLLQYGCSAEEIHHAMKRNVDGSPATPLGRAAALVHESSTTNQQGG